MTAPRAAPVAMSSEEAAPAAEGAAAAEVELAKAELPLRLAVAEALCVKAEAVEKAVTTEVDPDINEALPDRLALDAAEAEAEALVVAEAAELDDDDEVDAKIA